LCSLPSFQDMIKNTKQNIRNTLQSAYCKSRPEKGSIYR
jgi:hypothetical protein